MILILYYVSSSFFLNKNHSSESLESSFFRPAPKPDRIPVTSGFFLYREDKPSKAPIAP